MSDSGNILMTMTNTQEPQNTNTSGALAVAKAAAGLKLYDTASHAVSSFTPIKPGQVGIYVCGATVQSSPHIGHIRAAVAFDVVRRWFERLGYNVTFVRNVTDIDDKILDKAAAAGQQWWERAYIYEREFTEAYSKLGVEPPTYEPRATGHMIDMIDLIKKIIDNGHAYVVRDADGNPTGNVYFDVASWPHYGELTHQKQTAVSDAVSDAASEVTDAMGPSVDNAGNDKYNPVDPADASPDKHDPRDFALWKAAKPGEPSWDSPWGKGRPGWHIECSAMNKRFLGDTIDIHCGGQDLIFPHHENEIAQSECANGCTFSKYWMHNGYINVDNVKMSKSLGNFKTVREIANVYGYEVIRYFLISSHYRSPINYSLEIIEQCKSALERLYTCRESLDFALKNAKDIPDDEELIKKLNSHREQFITAMDDDLNTADGVAAVFELVKDINTSILDKEVSKNVCQTAAAVFDELCDVLGILYNRKNNDVDSDIEALIEERQQARANKDWATADRIRDELKAKGIILKDTPQGVTWTKE